VLDAHLSEHQDILGRKLELAFLAHVLAFLVPTRNPGQQELPKLCLVSAVASNDVDARLSRLDNVRQQMLDCAHLGHRDGVETDGFSTLALLVARTRFPNAIQTQGHELLVPTQSKSSRAQNANTRSYSFCCASDVHSAVTV
jgi:hypothetical protein